MININSIIHLEDKVFDIEKDEAILCIQDYKTAEYEFKKDCIYSVDFACSQKLIINKYVLTCTTKKYYFEKICNTNIMIPYVTLQDIQEPQIDIQDIQDIQETKYRFEKNKKPFKKNDICTESQIVKAGLDIQELFENEIITWLK